MKNENGKGITLTLTSELAKEFAHVVERIDGTITENVQLRAERDGWHRRSKELEDVIRLRQASPAGVKADVKICAWKDRCLCAENDLAAARSVAEQRGQRAHTLHVTVERVTEDRNTALAETVRLNTELRSLRNVAEVNQRVAEENVALRKQIKQLTTDNGQLTADGDGNGNGTANHKGTKVTKDGDGGDMGTATAMETANDANERG